MPTIPAVNGELHHIHVYYLPPLLFRELHVPITITCHKAFLNDKFLPGIKPVIQIGIAFLLYLLCKLYILVVFCLFVSGLQIRRFSLRVDVYTPT